GVVYLSADRKKEGVFPILSVAHNVALGTLDDRSRLGLVGFAAERRLVARSVATLGIRISSPGQEIRFLSGGNQQKALLARCLAAHRDLVIVYGALAALFVAGVLAAPHFSSSFNLTSLLGASLPLALVAIGQTFVVVTGGIDLSVGSTMSLTAVMAAMEMNG